MKDDREIRQNVRAAIDDCTRGIDEAPSLRFRILRIAKGEEPMKRKISVRIICIAAALLLLGTMTALAAGFEEVNAALYKLWPEAARALRPLNLSDEQAGIRLDIISAALTDDYYLVTYSLTDLKGDRINAETDCCPTLWIPLWERSGWNKLLSYDPEKHQAVYGAYFDYKPLPGSPQPRDTDIIRFSVQGLENPEKTTVDLWQLMNGRDYTADPVPVPSEYPWLETDVPEEEAVVPDVLNPADNLHIPVTDGVELSGIGWIDGNMHVQIHISDYMVQVEKEEIFYEFARYACIVTMWSPDTTARIQDSPGYVRKIEWREGNDLWIEQIFPVQPYEMSEYSIDAEFTFLRANIEDLLQYVWEVSFPANMIQVIPE